MPKILAAIALAAAAVSSAHLGQTPAFRSGVNLIEVDVVARDKTGKPVRGLERGDFQVFEDGKPVATETFTVVDLAPAPTGEKIPPPDASLSSIGSNEYPEDGRLFLIVLDDFHVRFDASRIVRTKRIARRLIERLAPGDLAAAVSTSSTRAMAVEFTNDKARLMAAVDYFFPADESAAPLFMRGGYGDEPAMNTGFVQSLKARFAADKLIGTARTFAQVQHRRKSVALVSEGMPFGLGDLMNVSSGGSDVLAALHEFIRIAQQSNIAVYTFDPGDGLEGRMTDRIQNLITISEGTGAFATVAGSDLEAGVDRMVDESGSYYMLGYYSPAKPNDGKHHRIKVQVARPGVQVSAREGYVSPKSASASKRAPAQPGPLDVLLAAPLQTRGLPIHVTAMPLPGASKDVTTVVVTFEVPGSTLAAGRSLELVVSAVGLEAGKVIAEERMDGKLATVRESVPGWVRFVSRVDLKPDRYQIRVVGRQGDGSRQGSVFTEVQVPKFDRALSVGGLALGTAGGAVNGEKFLSLLGIIPVPIRDVPASIELIAALPIRIDQKLPSETVHFAVTLIGPGGRAGQPDRFSRPASDFTIGRGAVFSVPVKGSEPGAYRLRIETALGTNKPVIREVAFTRLP